MSTAEQTTNQTRTRRVRHENGPRLLTVTQVETIVPRYVRVTFTGEELEGFTTLDPDDHMRIALPLPGQRTPTRPTWTDRGPIWPEGEPRPTIRDYTPRRFDPATNTLAIDFMVHGDGPASAWAERATPGEQVGAFGPRGSHLVDPVFAWYLLLGDETMLPSIARRLEEFPAGTQAIAIVEVESPANEHIIDTEADARIVWVHRDGAPAGTTTVLEEAVRALDFPAGEFFVWAGGEATTLRPIRRHLLDERGADRQWISFSSHWKRGVSNHDHHEPISD